jgi:hypothetical protein
MWFFAKHHQDEEWYKGGPSHEDAVRRGRERFEGDFWIVPGHRTTAEEEAQGQEHDYTVDIEHRIHIE